MVKKTGFTIGLAVLMFVIGGVVWLNVSPVWTYLFTGTPGVVSRALIVDENQFDETIEEDKIDQSSNFDTLQTMFRMTYIVLGAGLTAFAIFVSLADFLLHRRQGKSFFTADISRPPR